jgi:hypothetical protein
VSLLGICSAVGSRGGRYRNHLVVQLVAVPRVIETAAGKNEMSCAMVEKRSGLKLRVDDEVRDGPAVNMRRPLGMSQACCSLEGQ